MIYLDHNATTPVLPEVVEAILPWFTTNWGNPSSVYRPGRLARKAVEEAREKIATLVDARRDQVVFTSSATEANNAAIHSAIFRDSRKRHLVTSVVEHSAVLAYCGYLERIHGVEITRLPVDSRGCFDPESLRNAIRPNTALVSLMWANNETGVLWPIPDLAMICAEAGVPLHTDAVQAIGKAPVSFSDSDVSFLTLSGHKFGAPKGVGALIVKRPQDFIPFLHGGKQEAALRAGTENVPQIVGLGKAAELTLVQDRSIWRRVAALRDQFESEILAEFSSARINGYRESRLPNTCNIHLPHLDGDALVTFLDQRGICISSGSACLEDSITPSHVITAMTGSHDHASESVRISLGRDTTANDLTLVVNGIRAFAGLME